MLVKQTAEIRGIFCCEEKELSGGTSDFLAYRKEKR